MTRKRVLCVEDNDSNMRLVSRIVEGEKHEFLTAADGLTALALARRERPDLILLDINIPGLNGLELARRLKGDPTLATIPLIATTANVLLGDRERCLEAGCDDYLPKPLDVRELQLILRSYLSPHSAHAGTSLSPSV
jgi:two-component system cell cycle response regulator DivK